MLSASELSASLYRDAFSFDRVSKDSKEVLLQNNISLMKIDKKKCESKLLDFQLSSNLINNNLINVLSYLFS